MFTNVTMFIFWLVLPYLIAAAVRSMYKKLSESENPDKEAQNIGRAITESLRDAITPALQGVENDKRCRIPDRAGV